MRDQIEPLDQIVGAFLALLRAHAEIAAHPVHDLARRGEGIDIEFLRAQPDQAARLAIILHRIDAENLDLAGGRFRDTGDAMNGGGFARAIRAQKAEKFAFGNRERNIVNRDGAAAINLAQMGDRKCGSHGVELTCRPHLGKQPIFALQP